jgi:Fe-S-cluster containining protein
VQTNCEGCAGCCIDWRPLGGAPDHERRGRYRALDDSYNLAPLTSDEIRTFLDAGWVDALAPRLFVVADKDGANNKNNRAGDDGDTPTPPTVEIDGYELAAAAGKPLFAVGLRKTAKPVAPFDGERQWLETCVFLDPSTLQCRLHDTDRYPQTCATYPGHNLALDAETECERVEAAHGGDERLVDDAPPGDRPPLPFGPQALGGTVFAHPDPATLAGCVDRIAAGEVTADDRATFVGVAVASSPGSLAVDDDRRTRAVERAREAAGSSWIAGAVKQWETAVGEAASGEGDERTESVGAPAESHPDPAVVEDSRGAPPTPGWDAVD